MSILNAVVFLLSVHVLLLEAAVLPMTAQEVQGVTLECHCNYAVNWTSVPMTHIGDINFKQVSTLHYPIPAVIPSSANEVMVYAVIQVGDSGPNTAHDHVKIYTQEKDRQYSKYLGFATYHQNAWSTNSENMWFPMTTDRRLFVQVYTVHTNRIVLSIAAIGYR